MIRPAILTDCDPWLAIRNDPEAMFWSGQAQPIPVESHRAWFARVLERQDEGVYVVDADGAGPIQAYGRVQRVGLISLAVDPNNRGRGLGTQLLAHLTMEAQRVGMAKLVAVIHPSNVASMRAFLRAGYSIHPISEAVVQKVIST